MCRFRFFSRYLFLLLLALAICPQFSNGARKRPKTKRIKWESLENGIEKSKETGKLALVVFHKSWCMACHKLIPQIEKSKEIADLSVDFVMIKCGDDCDGSDDAYSPDGSYFPRVLLSDPAHGIRKELYNFAARPETKFFYSASSELHETMQRALQHHREL